MRDEEPDPLAAFEALAKFGRDFGEAVAAWLERMRPAFDAFLEVANRPDVRAAIEHAQSQPRPRPCYCLCPRAHPADRNVCDGEGVTTRRFVTERYGTVDVSLCAPCAVAQGLTGRVAP